MATVAVLSIGNELLKGNTINTNLAYIARELTSRGHSVVAAMEVNDNEYEICSGLKYLMGKAQCIITTGGLGPTFDDMTIRSISACLGLQYGSNLEALELVKGRLPRNAEMTEERKKMAFFPDGGVPIPNNVGTAPGLYLKHGENVILSFPGVPKEMEPMLISSIDKIPASSVSYYQESVFLEGIYESIFAPVIERLMSYYRGRVYIKSHPKSDGSNEGFLEIEVSSYSRASDESKALVKEVLSQVVKIASEMGGSVKYPGKDSGI